MPFLSPQIINAAPPLPPPGERRRCTSWCALTRKRRPKESKKKDKAKDGKTVKAAKRPRRFRGGQRRTSGAEGVTRGHPAPAAPVRARHQAAGRVACQFILLEHAVEMTAARGVQHVHRQAHQRHLRHAQRRPGRHGEAPTSPDEDYREHMKRILKKRGRLAPVRLESRAPAVQRAAGASAGSSLNLKPSTRPFVTTRAAEHGLTPGALAAACPSRKRAALSQSPVHARSGRPALTASAPSSNRCASARCCCQLPLRVHGRVRAASARGRGRPRRHLHQDHAVPPGDASRTWPRRSSPPPRPARRSRRCSSCAHASTSPTTSSGRSASRQAGCNVIYGFRDYKVHCEDLLHHAPDRKRPAAHHAAGHGQLQREDGEALHRPERSSPPTETIGRDAAEFFRNMAAGERLGQLRHPVGGTAADQARASSRNIDEQIALARAGKPCGLFFKTNCVTDKDVIVKTGRGKSQAGVPVDAARARHIVPGAGRGRLHRRRARGVHRGPSARAQPHLRLRPARGHASCTCPAPTS